MRRVAETRSPIDLPQRTASCERETCRGTHIGNVEDKKSTEGEHFFGESIKYYEL